MSDPAAPDVPSAPDGDVTDNGVFRAVLEGYDAVYDALPRGETFNRLWRMNAYDGDFPEQFAHIGFLTVPEARRLRELLQIRPAEALADLACGAGGPGLWMARESAASLIGIDPSAAGLAAQSILRTVRTTFTRVPARYAATRLAFPGTAIWSFWWD